MEDHHLDSGYVSTRVLNASRSPKSIILKEETDFIEPQLLRNHTKSEIFDI